MFTKKVWLPLIMGATILVSTGCSHTTLPTDEVPQDIVGKPSASAIVKPSANPTTTSNPSPVVVTPAPNDNPEQGVPTSFPNPVPDPVFMDNGPIDQNGNITGNYANGGDKPPVMNAPTSATQKELLQVAPEIKGKGSTQDKINVAQSYINYTNAYQAKDFKEACKYVQLDLATCITKLSTRPAAFFTYPEGIRIYHVENVDINNNIAQTNLWTFIYNGDKQVAGHTLIQSPKDSSIWFVE